MGAPCHFGTVGPINMIKATISSVLNGDSTQGQNIIIIYGLDSAKSVYRA